MNWQGFGLLILALGLVGVELAVNKWVRKVTNTYWFWLGIAIFYLVYCICITWNFYWKQLSTFEIPWGTPLNMEQSRIVSWALLLNICPFINFAFCATLIADPTRKAARAVAPFAIMGSFFVLFFEILLNQATEFTWQFIFLGGENVPDLHYFGHTMNLLIAIGVLLNTPKFGWKGMVSNYSLVVGFYIYVIIVVFSTGVQWYASGIVPNDFLAGGTYNFFNILFPGNASASAAVFFIGMAIFLGGICVLADVCKRGYFAYGDKYSGCWWAYYDYEKTTIKEPWGYFSHKWQARKKALK